MVNILWNLGHKIDHMYAYDKYSYLGMHFDNYRVIYLNDILAHKEISFPYYVVKFISEEGAAIMIANLLGEYCVSILLRSIRRKSFVDIGYSKGVLYGIGQLDADFKYGTPIILVEGPADRDSIVSIYPNVLAVKSSSLSILQIELISRLTNKVILLLDSDKPGIDGANKAKRRLTAKGVSVVILKHPQGIKDTGSITEYYLARNRDKVKELKEYYTLQIKGAILCFD